MDKVNLTMVTMLKHSFLIFCFYGLFLPVFANETRLDKVDTSEKYKVTFQRDRDYACTQCHKTKKQTLQGTHGENAFSILNREIPCIECHQSIGPEHRNGAPQVLKYDAAQSREARGKLVLSHQHILEENSLCVDCHTPERLRHDNWTHDVHAKQLTCSSCHTVHGKREGIFALSRKEKSAMCVGCHIDFNQYEHQQKH